MKFGFRYSAREDWPRFHRVVRVTFAFEVASSFVAAALIVAFAPFAGSMFGEAGSLTVPLLLAAPLPFLQSMESMGAQLLILRGRYDVRGTFLVYSMGLRLAGLAIGARHGVTATILGLLAAQVVTTASILAVGVVGLRRFPGRRRDGSARTAARSCASSSRARPTRRSTRSAPGSRRSRSASSGARPTSACSAARRRRRGLRDPLRAAAADPADRADARLGGTAGPRSWSRRCAATPWARRSSSRSRSSPGCC